LLDPHEASSSVEEFAHGRRLLVEAQEVPEVAARFLDDPRVIVVLGPSLREALPNRASGCLFDRAEGLLEDLEEKYSLIAFRPEVPAELKECFSP
jgi:hypothetical protein